MTLLFCNVTVPSSIGNFNIPCAVDGTARIFLIPGLPIVPLCWDSDLITMKFFHAEVECSSSPIFTSKDIYPSGQMVFPLNPIRISEDAPPSTYIQCTKCPPISASMIIGPSILSSSLKGGKAITVSGEKLWFPETTCPYDDASLVCTSVSFCRIPDGAWSVRADALLFFYSHLLIIHLLPRLGPRGRALGVGWGREPRGGQAGRGDGFLGGGGVRVGGWGGGWVVRAGEFRWGWGVVGHGVGGWLWGCVVGGASVGPSKRSDDLPEQSNKRSLTVGSDPRKCIVLSAVKSSNSSPWMHTRASNSELVKPLSEPERTLIRSSNSDTDKIMAQMDTMTMKMDAQYKEMQSRSNHLIPEYDKDDKPMFPEAETNSCKPSDVLVFTMITATVTQIVMIGVQEEETITIETTIDLILITNPTYKDN
ncbi:hypothetical protein Tco_0001370 [Tanacetum coccineum]